MICANSLTNSIAHSLSKDGIPQYHIENLAQSFVNTLRTEHPDWFKPEVIDVADFVKSRLSTESDDIRNVGNALLDRYRWDRIDHQNNPSDPYDKGAFWSSYYCLRSFAQIWDDHPDFKKIPVAVPFVQT